MSEELKPCPFCGGEKSITNLEEIRCCLLCSCESLPEHWNNRPIEDKKDAEIEELKEWIHKDGLQLAMNTQAIAMKDAEIAELKEKLRNALETTNDSLNTIRIPLSRDVRVMLEAIRQILTIGE